MGDVGDPAPRAPTSESASTPASATVDVFGEGDAAAASSPAAARGSWTDDGKAEFDLTINTGLGDVEVSRG